MTEWGDPALLVAYRNTGLSLWMTEESIADLRGTDHREILEGMERLRRELVDIRERLEDILLDMEVVL